MSKRFELKKWLTLGEVSQYLSVLFDDDFSEPEILRMVHDGCFEVSVIFAKSYWADQFFVADDKEIKYEPSKRLNNGRYITVAKNGATTIAGNWITNSGLMQILGAGSPYKLSWSNNGARAIRAACLKGLGMDLDTGFSSDGIFFEISPGETYYRLSNCLYRFGEDSELPLQPAHTFPDDCIFVITREELQDFLRKNNSPKFAPTEKEINPREKTNLLNIIGALLELNKSKEAAVIASILENHPGKPGLKERTLQEKFAEAKRSLKGT